MTVSIGLGWVSQLMGWVGSGHTKWTHGQLRSDVRPTVRLSVPSIDTFCRLPQPGRGQQILIDSCRLNAINVRPTQMRTLHTLINNGDLVMYVA